MANMRPLLDRLLTTHDLAAVVPRLHPEVLHRVIQAGGLEDCAELLALTTPAQLAPVLDADIWRARRPGGEEEFDADRFGLWLEVLTHAGPAVAAEKLAGLDLDLVIAGFAGHAAVFDHAAVSSYSTLDGQHVRGRAARSDRTAEIGGYVIEAKRTSAWDAIVELLTYLDAEHPEFFAHLMRGCVRLSNGEREADGFHSLLDDGDQHAFDVACGRQSRRARQGYVAPEQARAFLRGARDVRFDAERPPRSAIAGAYLRALESAGAVRDAGRERKEPAPASAVFAASEPDVAGVVEVLREAGLLGAQPLALLGDRQAGSRLALVREHVARDPDSAGELAYLANALAAGCGIQGRPFTATEASDAAAALCNLGLEAWPPRWRDADLVGAFQVGWTTLHRDVCTFAAVRLAEVLTAIRCSDRDIQLRLDRLRHELTVGVRDREPWRARPALDAIIMLDTPCWAALLGLIDECPVIHAALGASQRACRSVNPTDFAFISEQKQIAVVRDFLASLPTALTL